MKRIALVLAALTTLVLAGACDIDHNPVGPSRNPPQATNNPAPPAPPAPQPPAPAPQVSCQQRNLYLTFTQADLVRPGGVQSVAIGLRPTWDGSGGGVGTFNWFDGGGDLAVTNGVVLSHTYACSVLPKQPVLTVRFGSQSCTWTTAPIHC